MAPKKGSIPWNKGLRTVKKENVWDKINQTFPSLCWEWVSGKDWDGYGIFTIYGISYKVHRLVYELIYGIIPEGLCVCHHCDNPSCCNPKHLWLGSSSENNTDRHNKGRDNFARGNQLPQTKLNQYQVNEIRKLYITNKYTQKELGKRFGVCGANINKIINNITWKI